ncbi:chromate efflux transporter, partial [Rhodospirillum rubrum]|uniref:chromate efflux transporter n=2 Tax=Rhodospirillum rubrum TaxID=1085 RepID=UPI001F5BAA6D
AASPPRWRRALGVFGAFLTLGLTAFGGPIAHVGYFHRAFVVRRGWLDEAAFAERLALCQLLPGPTSSQLGVAIGLQRAGAAGALAAFLGFTLPSALLMAALALTLARLDGPLAGGLIAGLTLAAVAVVADAVLGMARQLCPDRRRASLALLTLACVLAWPNDGPLAPWGQMTPLAVAAALGAAQGWRGRDRQATPSARVRGFPGWRWGIGFLGLAGLGFFGLPLLAALAPSPLTTLAAALFQTGALVFGGGHVVLPLLQGALVEGGMIDGAVLTTGYGLAQAMPGPLFTIAAYLGAAIAPSGAGWGMALGYAGIATLAIFLPGFLLLAACLPFWSALHRNPLLRGAIEAVNAAVVGLLAAALWDLLIATAVRGGTAAALAVLTFLALRFWRAPPWLAVLIPALAGAAGML